jgi:hypothetical protein
MGMLHKVKKLDSMLGTTYSNNGDLNYTNVMPKPLQKINV